MTIKRIVSRAVGHAVVLCTVLTLCAAIVPPLYAAPSYQETDVEMRDGILLFTKIYLPDTDIWGPGPYPAVLSTTPYGIGGRGEAPPSPENWPAYVQAGYAYVTQDHRGRNLSQGVWNRATDGQDGYDTVEWMAGQAWCDGSIAMTGGSAGGIAAYQVAAENPPHLVTIVSLIASADSQNNSTFYNGAIKWETLLGWVLAVSGGLSQSHLDSLGLTEAEIAAEELANLMALGDLYSHREFVEPNRPVDSAVWMTLPLTAVPGVGLGGSWDHILTNFAVQNEYRDEYKVWDRIQIPALHIGGWYDIFGRGTMEAYSKIAGSGVPDQKMYMTPGIHPTVGTYIPPDLTFRWLEYWLKDVDNGIMDEAAVHYYLMGPDEWQAADQWPPPGVDQAVYYLHADGSLNRSFPVKRAPSTTYLYDPSDPVLTIGGRNLMVPAGAYDQRPVEPPNRDDVLVYTSDTLQEDLIVTGNVKVVLHASSDAPDTDFTAKLIDVYPDGMTVNVLDDVLRARFRESPRYEVFMTPGKTYALEIDLGDTAQVFQAGHRIQIDISSSNFPCKDRNPNTGNTLYIEDGPEDVVVAANTIHHDLFHRSYVVLPVMGGDFKNIRSELGDDPKWSRLDQDIFEFEGSKGEEVTIRLDAAPWKEGIGKRATLMLKDAVRGVRLAKIDRSKLPNTVKAKLPKSGTYRVIVSEQPRMMPGIRYRGAYNLTLDASYETAQSLTATRWVENSE